MRGFVFRTPYKHIHSALRWTLLECMHKQKNRHAQNRVEFKTGFLVLCRAKFLGCSLRKGVCCASGLGTHSTENPHGPSARVI